MSSVPLEVLIVEDEALIIMDIEAAVEDSGHHVTGSASSVEQLRQLALTGTPTLAFVDLQLAGKGSGIDACALILKRWPDTMIVFVTANPSALPFDFAGGHGVIPKPYTLHGLMKALAYLKQGIVDPPPKLEIPSSFRPSPELATLWAK